MSNYLMKVYLFEQINLGQTELPLDTQNYKSEHDHKMRYKLINFQSGIILFNPIQAAERRYIY